MRKIIFILFLSILFTGNNYSQIITGRVINKKGSGLPGVLLKLYFSDQSISTLSSLDGSFRFPDFIIDVNEESLPTTYQVSNNYPNPFNPSTRIDFTLPKESNVKIITYNSIGQVVKDEIEELLPAGNSFIDIHMDGLANGIYFALIQIDNRYSTVRKMLLLYGSTHLNTGLQTSQTKLLKKNSTLCIDSLVISHFRIKKVTIPSFLVIDSLNLGNIELDTLELLSDCLSSPFEFTVPSVNDTTILKDSLSCEYSCTIKKVELGKNYDEIVLYSPMFGQDLWAGAIVGARSIVQGSPYSLVINRKPLTINVLGLLLADNEEIVTDPYAGSVDAAVSAILNRNWDNINPTAIASYEYSETHTKEQVSVELGLKGIIGKASFAGGFQWDGINEKTSVFVKLVQRYYNVSIRKYNHYKDYIDTTTVLCSDFFDYLGENDFPTIINDVSYGRIILLQMICSKGTSTEKMQSTFEAIIGGSANSEQTDMWESCEKKSLILGGSPEQIQFITSPDSIVQIIREGMRFSKESPGIPLVYKSQLFIKGLPSFNYGLTTDFILEDCQLNGGDNLWTIYSFGCDCGHDNVYRLERDGTPICGSENCPGAPNSCWGNLQKLGGIDGAGSININFGQDYQVYGSTWLYVKNDTNIPNIPLDADVGRVWLNDTEITSSSLQLHLNSGWNHLEFTCYNQNDNARFRIAAPLADYVKIMDSEGCE